MNEPELIDAIVKRMPARTTKQLTKAFLEAMGEAIIEGLATTGVVYLRDVVKLVVVDTRALPERRGSHPVTKAPLVVRARPAGKKLRARFTTKTKRAVGQLPTP